MANGDVEGTCQPHCCVDGLEAALSGVTIDQYFNSDNSANVELLNENVPERSCSGGYYLSISQSIQKINTEKTYRS